MSVRQAAILVLIVGAIGGCRCMGGSGGFLRTGSAERSPCHHSDRFASVGFPTRFRAESQEAFSRQNLVLLGAVAAGSLAVGKLVDEPVADYLEDHKPLKWLQPAGDFAGYVLPVGLIGYAAVRGVSGDEEAKELSKALTDAALLTFLYGEAMVTAFGRERPRGGKGASHFEPFGHPGNRAFPMIHPSVVNAQLKVLSRFYPENTLLRVGRYLAVGSIGYLRMEKDSHWLSDVPLGIVLSEMIGSAVAELYLGTGGQKSWGLLPYSHDGAAGIQVYVNF